jgi:O-antigen ligase
MKHTTLSFLMKRIIDISLFFLFVCIPLVVNPFATDFWYKPKIESVYALVIIILIAVIIRHLFLNVPLRFKYTHLTIPLVVYAGSAVISTVFSIAPKLSMYGDVMREESMFTILAYVALTFIFSQLVESKKQCHTLIKGLIFSSLIISLNAIINYFGYFPIKHLVPMRRDGFGEGSFIGNANFLGKFLVLLLPLTSAYYLTVKTKAEKVFLSTSVLILLYALLLTFTRASWVGCMVGFVTFFILAKRTIFREKRKWILVSMIPALVIVVIATFPLLPDTKQNITDILKKRIYSALNFKEGKGVATRLFVWKKTIGIIQERPLIGYGPDAHVKAMETFNLDYCLKFNDWVQIEKDGKKVIRFDNWTLLDRAHNNYLDIAVGQGLIGLAAYISIILTFQIWLWRTIKNEEDRAMRIIFSAIFASVCGYLVNDLFIFSVVSVSPTFWSLMGLTISMKNVRT